MNAVYQLMIRRGGPYVGPQDRGLYETVDKAIDAANKLALESDQYLGEWRTRADKKYSDTDGGDRYIIRPRAVQ